MEIPDDDRTYYIVSFLEVAVALYLVMNGNIRVNTNS